MRLVPVSVTEVSPSVGPLVGEIPESVGGASNRKFPAEETPVGVVTEILTVPAA